MPGEWVRNFYTFIHKKRSEVLKMPLNIQIKLLKEQLPSLPNTEHLAHKLAWDLLVHIVDIRLLQSQGPRLPVPRPLAQPPLVILAEAGEAGARHHEAGAHAAADTSSGSEVRRNKWFERRLRVMSADGCWVNDRFWPLERCWSVCEKTGIILIGSRGVITDQCSRQTAEHCDQTEVHWDQTTGCWCLVLEDG